MRHRRRWPFVARRWSFASDEPRTTIDEPRATTVERVLAAVRRTLGMPDYATYLRHVAERHPGQEPMSEAAFFTDFIERRYADGPNRCC